MKEKRGKNKSASENANQLRKRAEEVIKRRAGQTRPERLSLEDARRLVHELSVHQIELEMQNEELRVSQVMIEEARRKYSDLYEFAPMGYFTIDREAIVLEANLTGAALLGIERSFLLGKPFTIYVKRDFQDTFYLHRRQVFQSGKRHVCELKLVRRDGTEIFGQMESMPINDKEFRSALSDITDRKRAEEELDKYRQNLEEQVEKRTAELKRASEELLKAQKLESLGILAGGIAHDFNNALTAIMNNLSVIKFSLKAGDNGEKALKTLEMASFAVQRATAMTHQLLTFARGGEPVKKTAYIRNLVKDTVDFSLRGSNISCDFHLAEDLWPVHADEGQIVQVISNLVINADQSMPKGGKIDVSAENVRLGEADRPPLKKGEYVRLTVKDRGLGIPEDYIDKIFDPYFTTKQRGSGLGLASSHSIIMKHEGYIVVESEVGKGTTFHVYLPAAQEDVTVKAGEVEPIGVKGGRVLVMDDDFIIASSLVEGLKEMGFEAEHAGDGTEAIELYRKAMKAGRPFDAVMMDLTVAGGMGGVETMKKLLKIDPAVKAIVTSGYSNNPVMSNFGEFGFADVITKPYEIWDLVKLLKRVLSTGNNKSS